MHYRTISLARNPFYRSFGIGFLSKNLLRKSQTVWLQFPLQIIVRIMNKLIIQFEANFRTFLTNQSGVGGTSPWNNVGKSFFFLSLPPHLRQTEHNDVWRWWGTKRLWPLSQRPKKDEIWRLTFSTTTTTKKKSLNVNKKLCLLLQRRRQQKAIIRAEERSSKLCSH